MDILVEIETGQPELVVLNGVLQTSHAKLTQRNRQRTKTAA